MVTAGLFKFKNRIFNKVTAYIIMKVCLHIIEKCQKVLCSACTNFKRLNMHLKVILNAILWQPAELKF